MTAAHSVCADVKCGDLQGIAFILDAAGERSVVAGATVDLTGPSLSKHSVTDERGAYSFTAVPPRPYRIEVRASGLTGFNKVTVASGKTLEISVQMKVEAIKQSVTFTGSQEPAISMESSAQTVINRSTVPNAPNKYDQFDSLLPLVPGVVRGPDGLARE